MAPFSSRAYGDAFAASLERGKHGRAVPLPDHLHVRGIGQPQRPAAAKGTAVKPPVAPPASAGSAAEAGAPSEHDGNPLIGTRVVSGEERPVYETSKGARYYLNSKGNKAYCTGDPKVVLSRSTERLEELD